MQYYHNFVPTWYHPIRANMAPRYVHNSMDCGYVQIGVRPATPQIHQPYLARRDARRLGSIPYSAPQTSLHTQLHYSQTFNEQRAYGMQTHQSHGHYSILDIQSARVPSNQYLVPFNMQCADTSCRTDQPVDLTKQVSNSLLGNISRGLPENRAMLEQNFPHLMIYRTIDNKFEKMDDYNKFFNFLCTHVDYDDEADSDGKYRALCRLERELKRAERYFEEAFYLCDTIETQQ